MHDVKKAAKASASAKLSRMGGKSRGDTWDGVPPVNTSTQAGLPIINKKPALSEETAERIMRKAGGRVGEKRLDKKPRAKKQVGGPSGADDTLGAKIRRGLDRLTGYESESDKQIRQLKDVGNQRLVDYGSPAMKGDRDKLDRMTGYKKGGKASWEGSKKDETQDKKLAKKHGMSMAKWEKSALDKKHDRQESMEGLKKGGRAARATGGRTGKPGKTTVNIVISGKGDGAGGVLPAGLGLGAVPPMPPGGMPMPPAGPLPPMPMGMGPGAPGGPLPRKKGGRANADVPVKTPGRTPEGYPKMDYGAATGQGRRQKILAQRD